MWIGDYLRAAEVYIDGAVELELRPAEQAIFHFTRVVRAHEQARSMTPNKVLSLVRKHCPGIYGWADTDADFEAEFFDSWETIRLPAGSDPLTEALRRADENRLGLFDKAKTTRPDDYARFVSLAGWLCVVVGKDRIKLPCDAGGAVMGVSGMTISRYRKFALKDGYMRVVKRARFLGNIHNEATTFKFRVDLWDCLKRAMPEY